MCVCIVMDVVYDCDFTLLLGRITFDRDDILNLFFVGIFILPCTFQQIARF